MNLLDVFRDKTGERSVWGWVLVRPSWVSGQRNWNAGNTIRKDILWRLEKDHFSNAGRQEKNVKFYTEKCGFRIDSTESDGDVELARFIIER